MNSEGLGKWLAELRERLVSIDAEIEQLESRPDVQERAAQRGADVLRVEVARGGAHACCRW